MLTRTGVSARTPYSPSRQGSFARRPTIGTTGRERIVSVIVASIASAPSPERTDSTSRSCASGLRTSRSQAQASELAVVSWPASTRVSSSERIS